MSAAHFYPIGKPGEAWGDAERAEWLKRVDIKSRSYAEDVLSKLEPLRAIFDVEQYGALSQDVSRYPLFVIKTHNWTLAENESKPCILVTGGVHGYETSGVHGALYFAQNYMSKYSEKFNIAIFPCVSPWGYECIQRWNAKTLDPNRYFIQDSPCEECAAVVNLIATLNVSQWLAHWDLHETTDSDDFEFRPAKASRDGLVLAEEGIPDGFYLIGDLAKPQTEWHTAMIQAVGALTHIAPADKNNQIIELDMTQPGVVNSNAVGKGKGVSNATYATTTEVYPDSKSAPLTSDLCNRAQVAAITGGLEYIITVNEL